MSAEGPLFAPALITPASLRASTWQTVLHVNYGRKGSLLKRECISHPGLIMSSAWDKRARTTERSFFVQGDDRTFATVQEAAKAWNDQRRGEPQSISEVQRDA